MTSDYTGHGRPPGRPNSFPARDDELRRLAEANNEAGKPLHSTYAISDLMDIPWSTIVRRLKELGLNRARSMWSDEQIELLRDLAVHKENGRLLTTNEIAARIGFSRDMVWKKMRQLQLGYDDQGRSIRDTRFNLPALKKLAEEGKLADKPKRPHKKVEHLPISGSTLPPLPSLQQPLPKCCYRRLELVRG